MFDAIKRVISGEDVAEENLAPTEDGTNPEPNRSVDSGMVPSSGIEIETTQPAIVENDLDHGLASDNNKLTLPPSTNDDRSNHESYTPRSSLSDVSAGHNDDEIVESTPTGVTTQRFAKMVVDDDGMLDRSNAIPEQAAALFATRGNFPRNDSRVSNDSSSGSQRASSQNSSRDWGWFEDVHVSEQSSSPYLKRKDTTDDKNNKKKGKRGGSGGGGSISSSGLVPQVSEGTSSGGLTEIIQAGLDNGRFNAR